MREWTTRRAARPALAAATLLSVGSCAEIGTIDPANGEVEIRAVMTYVGREPLPADSTFTAYVQDVQISDNRAEKTIPPGGSARFGSLGVGIDLQVGLADLPGRCTAPALPARLTERNRFLSFSIPVTCRGHLGSLTISVLGPGGDWTPDLVVDGPSLSGFRSRDFTTSLTGLVEGTYTVRAEPVAAGGTGLVPSPRSVSVPVVDQVPSHVDVTYGASTGALEVDVQGLPAGAAASVTVRSPTGFSWALDGSGRLDALLPGVYELRANTVFTDAGATAWIPTPFLQTIDVEEGLASAQVTYAAAGATGSLEVTVRGLPAGTDGDLEVEGPAGATWPLTGDALLQDLAPGAYTIRARPVQADFLLDPEPGEVQVVVPPGGQGSATMVYWTVSPELLVDPGLEAGPITVESPPIPVTLANWRGDNSTLVGPDQGIDPGEGTSMLRCLATGPFGPGAGSTGCEIYQLVDLSAWADAVDGGTARVRARSAFNRVAGDPSTTDRRFVVDVYGLDGTPADVRDRIAAQLWVGRGTTQIDSDADPATWEPLSADAVIPAGTRLVLLRLVAVENVVDDADTAEFAGHYMDDAGVVLRWIR